MDIIKITKSRQSDCYLLEFTSARVARKCFDSIQTALYWPGRPLTHLVADVVQLWDVGKYLTFFMDTPKSATELIKYIRKL